MSSSSRWLILIGFVLFALSVASLARADHGDPSGRVARVNHAQGEVSYSPAGEDQWLGVMRNRPLIRGDRLWTGRRARAELQVGSAALRLGSLTSFEILELNDRVAQVQLSQGTLGLSVRGMYRGQIIEVDTPTLAFTIDQPGRYRIDVAPDEDVTTIVVWEGEAEAYGEDASFPLVAGDTVRFYGADLRDYEMYGPPPLDEFDRYGLDRDQRLARSESLRYVGDDMAGYSDLDGYGSWRRTAGYGNVWYPSRIDAGWAPYRDGHWIWQEPWGWTWVDNAPWGFAPSHYGRWAYLSDRWGWIPGPRNVRPIYAPALVAFIDDEQGDGSPIGWFPLGPREVYVPSYRTSREYFTQVNVNNTGITTASITEGYAEYSRDDGSVRQATYVNREVADAVTAVPREVFVNARSVQPAAVRLDRTAFATGEVSRIAPIAPSVRSVLGAGEATRVARPSNEVFDRRVVARSAPPPAEQPFATRERRLQQTPGRSPEPSAGGRAKDRNPGNARNVRVLAGQRDVVNVREAESRRDDQQPGDASALQPLDRSSEARSARVPVDQPQRNEPLRQPEERAQEVQRQRRAEAQEAQQQEAQQRRAEEAQQREAQRQQAEARQEAQRQRRAEAQQQEAQQRQAEAQQQEAQQRQAEAQQQEAQQRQAEAQQQREAQQRQAEAQQQEAQQREAQQRQVEAQQQEAQRQRQAEAQQEVQRQADALQEAQRVSQNEAQQQAQAQREAERELQAAQKQDEPSSESDASPRENRDNRPADPPTKGPRHRKAKDTDDEEAKDEDAAKEDPRDPAAHRHPTRTRS